MQRLVMAKITDAIDPRRAPTGRTQLDRFRPNHQLDRSLLGSCQQHPADRTLGGCTVGAAGQQICLPDKRGDLACGWPRIDLLGRPRLDHLPIEHDDDPIRDAQCFLLVVGHENGGRPGAFENGAHIVAQSDPQRSIQARKRLIQQHQSGLWRQCTRQRNPLLLSTGELMRVPAGVSFHPHQPQ